MGMPWLSLKHLMVATWLMLTSNTRLNMAQFGRCERHFSLELVCKLNIKKMKLVCCISSCMWSVTGQYRVETGPADKLMVEDGRMEDGGGWSRGMGDSDTTGKSKCVSSCFSYKIPTFSYFQHCPTFGRIFVRV